MNKGKFIVAIICIFSIYLFTFLVASVTSKKQKEPTKVENVIETKKENPKLKILNNEKPIKKWAYYLNDINFEKIKNSDFDLVVIDLQKNNKYISKETILSLKKKPDGSKRKILAYMSLGYAESYRPYWKKEWNKKNPKWLGKENKVWKNNFEVIDLMNEEWLSITKSLINVSIENQFDGILISGLNPIRKTISFIKEIKNYTNRSFEIFVQDLESLVNEDDFIYQVDGFVKQGLVYTTISKEMKEPSVVSKSVEFLNKAKKLNKTVLVIEYVSGEKWNNAKVIIEAAKYIPYNSNLRLDKLGE